MTTFHAIIAFLDMPLAMFAILVEMVARAPELPWHD
jgi:hypothetical protein